MTAKRVFALLLCFMTVLFCAACGNGGGTPAAPNDGAKKDTAEVKGLSEPFAEKPVLITSAGQSADVQMLGVAAGKVDLECEVKALISADEFDPSAYKTIVFAVGGSSKGLGAAGIDKEQELARCLDVIDKAKDSCSIIVAHIGGSARRGTLSDTFIAEITPYADYIILLDGANEDGLFTKIATDNDIPMDVIENIADSGVKLAAAFVQ